MPTTIGAMNNVVAYLLNASHIRVPLSRLASDALEIVK
jgi:hypothetical protein